jgi:hypothetical protein
VGDLREMGSPGVAIVCVASTNCRGYNNGVRLGVQIRQPYPGNGANRQQMEGRICRINQTRDEVFYETIYMRHTLMELLYERQERDDGVNHSLDELAEEYDRSVVDGML